MLGSVIVVTPPDDILSDAVRVLCVNLDQSQTKLISDCLRDLEFSRNISVYIWQNGNDFDWLIDKKAKSDLIIFNADHSDMLTGYLAGLKNSYYFGNLKNLDKFNTRCIFDSNVLKDLFYKVIE